MTCSRSLICQTKPPALLGTWSGSRRNHCGTAARMSFDWAAWAVIAWAAAEGFLEDLALLVDDFLIGMTRLTRLTRLTSVESLDVVWFWKFISILFYFMSLY